MYNARRPLQIALLALALLCVILYFSAAFQPQYPEAIPPQSTKVSFSKSTTGDDGGVLERLEKTLQKLENTPISSYDQALRKNEQTCENRQVQSNPDQIAGQETFWREVRSEELAEKRQNIINGIRDQFGLPGLQYAQPNLRTSSMYGSGRGLVFTGGNKVCRNSSKGHLTVPDTIGLSARIHYKGWPILSGYYATGTNAIFQ